MFGNYNPFLHSDHRKKFVKCSTLSGTVFMERTDERRPIVLAM